MVVPSKMREEALSITEVDDKEVRKALKVLLINRDARLAHLYSKHDEYNREHFSGMLSTPYITIEKLHYKTLGNHTRSGYDNTGLDNHIRLNRNFVALNTEERVDETLLHEMIHQWQDEILYFRPGETSETNPDKKPWPRNGHNKDFFDKANEIGLVAKPPHGYGSPCNMPKSKSYNRKYMCGCIATNGHPVTIWSTRPIDGTCNRCKTQYFPVPKKGDLIALVASSVEKKTGDSVVEEQKKLGFNGFKRFKEKDELDIFVDQFLSKDGSTIDQFKINFGHYQKNHNMHKKGYRYWAAYKTEGGEPNDNGEPKAAKQSRSAKG